MNNANANCHPLILVIGNCQAQMLEGILALGLPQASIKRVKPNFMMTEEDKEPTISLFQEADHIFAQRVSESFQLEWLRPSWLRREYRGKTTIWPNIYFDGYFPGVGYLYLPAYGKLQGPLDDYHFAWLFNAHKAGLSCKDAVSQLRNPCLRQAGSFAASLKQLTERERDVDVKISDFLERQARFQKVCYTPNHPTNVLLINIAKRLATHVGEEFADPEANRWQYNLDKIKIPVLPNISEMEGLAFEEEFVFEGPEVKSINRNKIELGESRMYEPEQLIESFYGVYDEIRQYGHGRQ